MYYPGFVALDIDGVLADLSFAFGKFAKELGLNMRPVGNGRVPTWSFATFITKEEEKMVWKEIKKSKEFWLTLPILFTPSDRSDLAELAARFQIVYITNRQGKNVFEQTAQWVKSNSLPIGPLLVTDSKVKTIRGIPGGLFLGSCMGAIDDKPLNVLEMNADSVPTAIRDWPYNREIRYMDNELELGRVYSLSEFVGRVLDRADKLKGG